MSASGKARLVMAGCSEYEGDALIPALRPSEVAASAIWHDYVWGGFPPPVTQIPYNWLTPPAQRRPDQPRNLAAVSRTRGATAYARDRTSIAANGERPFAVTLDTQVADDPVNYANWIVGNYTNARQRMPRLRLNLLSRTQAECWRILGREIGDRISITGAPPSTLPVVGDRYTRNASNGLGTTDTGQPYVISGGSTADYSVTGTRGAMALPTVSVERTASIANVGADVDVTVYLVPTIIAGGAQFQQKIRVRHNGSNWYETNVQYQTDGTIVLYLVRGFTALSGLAAVLPYDSSTTFGVRMQAYGSTIRQKVWDATGAEPAAWTATVTDTTLPGNTTDSLMLEADRVVGNTDAGLVVQWDNLTVSTPNPTGWPDGVTELVIEGIEHSIAADTRWVTWNTAPLIGASAGQAGPWFRANVSRTDTGSDLLAF